MTVIVIEALKTDTPLPTGITFAGTAAVVTDNAGNVLPAVVLTGAETPPWTATLTGDLGSQEASVTFTDLDTAGNTIGTPVTITETGSGGFGTFPATTGGTITVTG